MGSEAGCPGGAGRAEGGGTQEGGAEPGQGRGPAAGQCPAAASPLDPPASAVLQDEGELTSHRLEGAQGHDQE